MAMRITPKSKKSSSPGSRPLNSPSSSNTSSSWSRQFPEVSIDNPNSPASSSSKSRPQYSSFDNGSLDTDRIKENVTVTVRFRPLSPREIRQGDEVAWYADGDTIVRNEHNPSIAYAYDRVFGPTTTTRHVYDVAAQHVVGGAMEGINAETLKELIWAAWGSDTRECLSTPVLASLSAKELADLGTFDQAILHSVQRPVRLSYKCLKFQGG